MKILETAIVKPTKPQTNYEKIMAEMTVEKLAELSRQYRGICPSKHYVYKNNYTRNEKTCIACWGKYLNSEASE